MSCIARSLMKIATQVAEASQRSSVAQAVNVTGRQEQVEVKDTCVSVQKPSLRSCIARSLTKIATQVAAASRRSSAAQAVNVTGRLEQVEVKDTCVSVQQPLLGLQKCRSRN